LPREERAWGQFRRAAATGEEEENYEGADRNDAPHGSILSLTADKTTKGSDRSLSSSLNHAMDLTGQLSNPPEPLVRLLSILSRPTARTKRRPTKPKPRGYVEGRRRFGSVGKSVIDVLTAANRELTAHEIRKAAERLLGGSISTHSISYQLRSKSRGHTPAIVQRAQRYYRLADSRI
jgi:hypothetical protein